MGRPSRTTTYCVLAIAFVVSASLGAAPKDDPKEPDPAPLFPLEPAWTLTLDARPAAGGAMDDANVYFPLETGALQAFARETGDLVWTAEAPSMWRPALGAGRVFVADADTIRAVDASTGTEVWQRPLAQPLTAPLTWDSGWLIVATDGGALLGVRADDGQPVWTRDLGSTTRQPAAALSTGLVVVSLENSTVVALDRGTGEVRWTRTLAGTLSAPAAAGDRVFVGTTSNDFYALDPGTGKELWHWRVGGDIVGAAVDGDVVYFASLDNILRAVNRSNGNQRWKTEVPTRPALPPVAFGGVVLITGVAPRVDGWVGRTGAVMGSHRVLADGGGDDSMLQGAPLVDAPLKPYQVGMVTLTRAGRVSALRPEMMMMRDPATVPLKELPGRRLERERLDTASRTLPPTSVR